jgi:tetratricopeptide (TPR) repeat protein
MFMKTPCYLKKSLLSILFCLFLMGINAQNSAIYTEANLAYKKAMNLYEEGIVGLAQTEFKKVFETLRPLHEPELVLLRTKAELFYAKCAVRLNQPDGERLIIDFARTYDPDPLANQAILEMADYYFNSKDYARAAELLRV